MFGISTNTQIKIAILEILDNANSEITTEKLTKLLTIPTSQTTVKKICNELLNTINSTYPHKDIHMLITNKGVKLNRQNFHFDMLTHNFYSEELAYDLLNDLLAQRTISTAVFCTTYYISESQLRRLAVKLNENLSAYGLHISVATEVKIKGPEYRIRYTYFLFLYFCYRNFTNIPWIVTPLNFVELGDQILHDLAISVSDTEADFFYLWLYVNQQAIDAGFFIEANDPNMEIFSSLSLPTQPQVLEKWYSCNWTFFITTAFAEDIIPITVEADRSLPLDKIIRKQKDIWLKHYEHYFTTLTPIQTTKLYDYFFKHVISQMIFPVDQVLINLFKMVDLHKLERSYPTYLQTFYDFWQAYSDELNEKEDKAFLLKSLLFSSDIVPFSQFFPTVTAYLYSSLSAIYQNYTKERIRSYFMNQCHITFCENIEDATLIIATTDYIEKNKKKPQHFVLINNTLSSTDLQNIQQRIYAITPEISAF